MQRVAILGAGAGGMSAAVELQKKGIEVRLWNRSPSTLAPLQEIGGVDYEGVLGEGHIGIEIISSKLEDVLSNVDAALVCLPTFTHGAIARSLAQLKFSKPVVLNPGHTGGALEFRNAWLSVSNDLPPLAEFSTLTYVARKVSGTRVRTSGAAKQVRVGALPGGEAALRIATSMYPGASPVETVLMSALCNANLVLHPPASVLAAAWVEARQGDFTFYVDGMTPGVARVMEALDDERRNVANAFGYLVPSLIEEMKLIGTVESHVSTQAGFAAAISSGEANQKIRGPDSFEHRYYLEDFAYGLVPFIALAEIAKVDTPVAGSLLNLAESMTGNNYRATGRNADRMGIQGLDLYALKNLVAP